jgi:ParB family chromosome partitioning protein
MSKKKRALGRGLSALLEQNETESTASLPAETQTGNVAEIAIAEIETNPFQPRTHFEEQALQELADSIRVHGIIQPIAVRQMAPNKYQLISGERRFRASQLAGLTRIPAYLRVADDQTMLEMALVENIQRSDLNAIEVAISYQRLLDECKLTQEELGQKVSKNRATVTNYLRLLKLAAPVQLAIRDREISMGHARALAGAEGEELQTELLGQVLSEELSVRQTEALVKGTKPVKKATKKRRTRHELTFIQSKHVKELKESLDSSVEVRMGEAGKGKISITFEDDEDLSRILDLLNS